MRTLPQSRVEITALNAALMMEALARALVRLESLETQLDQVRPLADSSLTPERRIAFELTIGSVREMREKFNRERADLMRLLETQAVIGECGCAREGAEVL